MCPHDADHSMAQCFDDLLDVHRDDRFILDDEHFSGQRVVNRGACVTDQFIYASGVDVENSRHFALAKTFNSGQQKALAHFHRKLGNYPTTAFGRQRSDHLGIPQPMKNPEQFGTDGLIGLKYVGRFQKRFQHLPHPCVAQRLRAGERARIAAKKRQFGNKCLT